MCQSFTKSKQTKKQKQRQTTYYFRISFFRLFCSTKSLKTILKSKTQQYSSCSFLAFLFWASLFCGLFKIIYNAAGLMYYYDLQIIYFPACASGMKSYQKLPVFNTYRNLETLVSALTLFTHVSTQSSVHHLSQISD